MYDFRVPALVRQAITLILTDSKGDGSRCTSKNFDSRCGKMLFLHSVFESCVVKTTAGLHIIGHGLGLGDPNCNPKPTHFFSLNQTFHSTRQSESCLSLFLQLF